MKKKLTKMISLFMAVVMITTIIPIGTYANETEKDTSESFSAIDEKEIEIEHEIESKRTENSKTFLTSDGALYQVSTSYPVHEKKNDEWEEISEVKKHSVKTVEDVEKLMTELGNRDVDSGSETGLYESESLSIYTNGSTNPYSIKGIDATVNGKASCLYVKPNIISEKSVFIFKAKLTLDIDSVDNNADNNLIAYRLTNDLTPPVISVLPCQDNSPLDKVEVTPQTECDVNVTSYCHYASLGVYNNTGIALKPCEDNTSINIGENGIVLGIYYREIGDVDGGVESETKDLGRAGTLYVNDYTCTPVIVRNEFGLFSELAEVDLQTVVSPSAIDDNSSDGVTTRMNYSSILKYGSNEYYWKDCSGDNIYFVKNNLNEYKGVDSKGVEYTLTNNATNAQDFANVEITNDNTNTVYSFITYNIPNENPVGYLTNIAKSNGSNIVIHHKNSNTDKDIDKIVDGSGREYVFNYTNNMLSSVNVYFGEGNNRDTVKINNTDVEITYHYNNDNKLSEVVYPDGYTIEYNYDSNGRMSTISAYTDSSKTNHIKTYSFTYENYKPTSNVLKKLSITKNNNTTDLLEFSPVYNSIFRRKIEDKVAGTNKVVQYDINGNLIYYKDYDEQEYYLDYHNNELNKLIFEDTSGTNYISNGDFSSNSSWSIPYTNVEIVNNAPDMDNTYIGGSGNQHALRIRRTNNNTYVTQNISRNDFNSGNSYVLCCSARCDGTLPTDDKKGFSASIYYTESNENIVIGKIDFDYSQVGIWQTGKVVVTLPKKVNQLTVSLNDCFMTNTCYFTNVRLYPATTENVKPIDDVVVPNDEVILNPNKTISDIIRKKSGEKMLSKHYSYNNDTFVSSINEEGKTTFYNYDSPSGLLFSKGKNASSNDNAQYTYSGIGALLTVEQIVNSLGANNPQSVSYSYYDDSISSITHNGTTYDYTYNDKGQVTNITVLDNSDNIDYEISYEYDGNNVGVVEFGNGSSITYVYQGNRIVSTVYDNGLTGNENEQFEYLYEYNDDGSIHRITDNVLNQTTTYTGTGCEITRPNNNNVYKKTNNKIYLFNKSFSYENSVSNNNNTKSTYDKYTGSLTGPIVENTSVLDNLDRQISSETINRGSLDYRTHYKLNNSIEYVPGNNNRETSLVKKYTATLAKRKANLSSQYNNTRLVREWNYNYDSVGRITSVFRKYTNNITYSEATPSSYTYTKGNLAYYYQYDEGGEIALELDLVNNRVIKYNYDESGNIASKIKYNSGHFTYSYNENDDTISISLNNGSTSYYSYKSNGMTDYLTGFDNHSISYDQSGNPITFAAKNMFDTTVSGTMTWNGNLLTSFNNGNEYYEYTYDAESHRTGKRIYEGNERTIPKTIIDYIWDGDTLVGYKTLCYGYTSNMAEEDRTPANYVLTWNKTVKLVYSDGVLVGACILADNTGVSQSEEAQYFDWNTSTTYTFVRDGRGNITDVYDSNEKVIVSMSYDAYGNMTPRLSGSFIQEIEETIQSSGSSVLEKFFAELAKAIIKAIYINGMFLTMEQGYDGYIFDMETGLYYGQARYYCPSWGRYLNANDSSCITDDIGNVYSSNLFNYCFNDPINNKTKTGFNNSSVISNSLLSQMHINNTNMEQESKATADNTAKVENSLNVLSLKLKNTADSNSLSFWNNLLDKKDEVPENNYGFNFMHSAVSKNTMAVTDYSIEYNNTPYKAAKSVE